MATKRVILPERVRQIPAQFSWVDHRLVRDRHIDRCDAGAGFLYLFLVTVADNQGLSYYADDSLRRRLSMAPDRLVKARDDLMRAGLIAYRKPLYQVLALDPLPTPASQAADDAVRARLDALRAVLGKRHD